MHNFKPISLRSILILSSHLRLGIPNGLFPPDFSTKILYTFLILPTRATWPTNTSSLRFIIILLSHLRLGLPSGLFLLAFLIKILFAFILSQMRAVLSTHQIFLDLISLITFGEVYKL